MIYKLYKYDKKIKAYPSFGMHYVILGESIIYGPKNSPKKAYVGYKIDVYESNKCGRWTHYTRAEDLLWEGLEDTYQLGDLSESFDVLKLQVEKAEKGDPA